MLISGITGEDGAGEDVRELGRGERARLVSRTPVRMVFRRSVAILDCFNVENGQREERG